jgi:ABC-type polysaccharide/polyol phosphate transport system ATPase subunit
VTTAIHADRLSKVYQLGEREAYTALRDTLSRLATAPFSRLRAAAAKASSRPWIKALDGVSFDIAEGEVIGLIGRNGSGKSTLLKVLSRITEPSSGSATIRGRVGSLLEVGTGFHPELTGRENVFFSGVTLGMTRRDVARRFDEIVAFADLEKFVDTPVKFYSSGMHMRLGFAVAAHLQPNILLVDEVLAVGDVAFQKKCLGKMDEISHEGRTIVFVSHQMNQLRRLCGRCLWLDAGRVVEVGPTANVINHYEASFMDGAAATRPRNSSKGATWLGWTLGAPGSRHFVLDHFGSVDVRFQIRIDRPVRDGHHGLALYDRDGQVIWGTGIDNLQFEPGTYEIAHSLSSLPVRPGPYRWHVSLFSEGALVDNLDCIPEMSVETVPLGHRRDEYAGLINIPHETRMVKTDIRIAV